MRRKRSALNGHNSSFDGRPVIMAAISKLQRSHSKEAFSAAFQIAPPRTIISSLYCIVACLSIDFNKI
jgi:hypothetical protein